MVKEFEKYPAFAKINLSNLAHNVRIAQEKIHKTISDKAEILAVIKADAYGHGVVMVAKRLEKENVNHFAVANIDEAVELRKNNIGGMILILGCILPSRYADAADNDISVTVESYDALKNIEAFAKKENKKIKIHIKLNTGMNRIGFATYDNKISCELVKSLSILRESKNLLCEGIFSHFSNGDDEDKSITDYQFKKFMYTVNELEKMGFCFRYRHICNSVGTLYYPEFHLDLVRYGIGLYGCEYEDMGILPVMSFKAHIVAVHNIKKGESIGYSGTFTAQHDMRVATVCAGYADGVDRLLSNRGYVLCHDKRAKILGRVCMDMMMIDVSDIDNAKLYDIVTIFGKDENETLHVEEDARLCGTISYELLCRIGKRAKRIYEE